MYHSRRIDSSNISEFEALLPEHYSRQIRSGLLFGGAVFEPEGEEQPPALVSVMAYKGEWLELIWIGFPDRTRSDSFFAELIRTLIRRERFYRGLSLKGVYAEFHSDIKLRSERIRNVMILAGMESIITKSNVYEFPLSAVEEASLLQKAKGRLKCIPLSGAKGGLFDQLDELIQTDARPSPLPLFVNWDVYLQEESLICLMGEEPCGILLFSRNGEYLVIDCAFVTQAIALPVLLGNACAFLKERYGEAQRILVPVVIDRTASIVERLVPGAERVDVVEAVLRL